MKGRREMFWMEEGNEWFCTVFPNDPDEMPQDFPSYAAAKEYGNEMFGEGNYEISSPC